MEINKTNATWSESPGNLTNIQYYHFYETEQRVFLCILFLSIIVGNIAVLVVVLLTRKLRSRMNIFMANLAIADIMVGLSVLVDVIEKFLVEWHGGNFLCKAVRFYQGVANYGSTYALVAISIDRFDSVARPLQTMGKGYRIHLLIGLQWAFSLLFSLPMFIYEEKEVHSKMQCFLSFPEPWIWKVYVTILSLVVMFIPAVIIAICYVTIVAVVWMKSSFTMSSSKTKTDESCMELSTAISKDRFSEERMPLKPPRQRRVHWTKTCDSSSRGLIPKAKIKTVKMTFVIVLAFILCWSPYWVYNILQTFGYISPSQTAAAVSVLFQSLFSLNSAANPVIFFLFNSALYKRLCVQRGIYTPPSTSISHV
ncbi:cardioacceleratory peptide receptor-like [Ostrea edulis]|uniref:cardioacceleratory peptide receptor-like n=1 Tax=Ostrea edulis TaxID=37623 RepID=UPI0024AF2DD2|nr:cardioacceleratory peptide receptor-like [Ostrea edulis]